MKEIGGYFELEMNRGGSYHSGAIELNLGRTSIEYILRAKKVKKIFLPFFTCQAVIDPVRKTGVPFEFYHVSENLEPVFDFSLLSDNDHFFFINYFGIKGPYLRSLAGKVKNLIIDNSQSFFSMPLPGVDTFYSPRKFFGVPDGGYLFTDKKLDTVFEQDISWERANHLLVRADKNAEEGYSLFKMNEENLDNLPLRSMSKLTKSLLANIDYLKIRDIRESNFLFMHEKLGKKNEFNFDAEGVDAPMVYPYLTGRGGILRKKLIENKIFVAKYWDGVTAAVREDSVEARFVNNLVPLPIDQRYGIRDMEVILKNI